MRAWPIISTPKHIGNLGIRDLDLNLSILCSPVQLETANYDPTVEGAVVIIVGNWA